MHRRASHHRLAAFLALAASLALTTAPARAQDDPLSAAEQAYLDVDFARALELAQQALDSGAYGPSELARIYRLIGIAAAAADDDARAVDAFQRLFALDPEAQPDENLSPRLRQPFMEAFGRWTALRGRFQIQARRLQGARGVGLDLEDPLSMASRVEVFTRVAGRDGAYAPATLEPASQMAVPLEGLTEEDTLETYVRVLDAHGNRLIELGSELEPHVLEGAAPAAPAIATATPDASAPVPEPSSGLTPWLFGIGTALTLVSAGILAWSIADVVLSHDDYMSAPTLDKYYHGLDLQTRTNVLIGTTAALGAATVILAIFTDWGSRSTERASAMAPRWTVFASPTAAGAAVAGRF